jgi:hypothetical protein
MALAALTAEGAAAGWIVVGLLVIFAIARSVCSVSYKDVLGKTVSKSTRGTATGTAGTLAALLVLVFGGLLTSGIIERSVETVASVLAIAGCLWLVSAAVFSSLFETGGATEGGRNPLAVAVSQFSYLRDDPQLIRFIAARSLLTATAIAPPYFVALSGQSAGRQFGQLGAFVIASGLAAVSSSFVWGRLSDRSSRKVLIFSALIGAIGLGSAAVFGIAAGHLVKGTLILPGLHFVLMIAHQGVRVGRATHIVDMADPERRAIYTALSNTIIGLILVLGGVFGAVAQAAGEAVVLLIFTIMAVAAAFVAGALEEVQTGNQ